MYRICCATHLPGPQTAAKYLKADAKPSDIPEFLREFKVGCRVQLAGHGLLGRVQHLRCVSCR